MPRPTKSKAKRRVGLAVYLEPAILRKLKSAAEGERRSASTLAALFIEQGLGLPVGGRRLARRA
jgi:hypothetical protein